LEKAENCWPDGWQNKSNKSEDGMYQAMDEVKGRLPDLLQFKDGRKVRTKEDWLARRQEIFDEAVELAYGGMPPDPEFLEVEQLHMPGRVGLATYRIKTGRKSHPFSFCLQLSVQDTTSCSPVVLTGDGCYKKFNDAVVAEINRRGMIGAKFNRTEFAHDMYNTERKGGLYDVYPECHFGALAAWAWGYHRCLDALEQIHYADADKVAITGHSRGGKTVLLAGATDQRFAFVNPNNSGAGGAGCFRYQMVYDHVREGEDRQSETLSSILKAVPYWFGPDLGQYIGRETELPFDQHFFKAFIAPRCLLETEALGDTWANPKGSYQTYAAAREVYALLGCDDNIGIRYRPGGHDHTFEDFCVLLDFMENRLLKEPLPDVFRMNPFADMPFIG
jgi:hypothetical protein